MSECAKANNLLRKPLDGFVWHLKRGSGGVHDEKYLAGRKERLPERTLFTTPSGRRARTVLHAGLALRVQSFTARPATIGV